MQDVPDSTPNNLKVDLEDILDPDERTNDIDEERRTADHESEFYDGDKDQDGDTMPPNQLSSNNTKNDPSSSSNNTGKFFFQKLKLSLVISTTFEFSRQKLDAKLFDNGKFLRIPNP